MNNVISFAYDYALKLGISPSISGFDKFVQAVAAYASTRGFPLLENVCNDIAAQCSMHSGTVMHAISYALKSTRNLCDRLYELTDVRVCEEDIRPKFVICLVANCIKRDLQELA